MTSDLLIEWMKKVVHSLTFHIAGLCLVSCDLRFVVQSLLSCDTPVMSLFSCTLCSTLHFLVTLQCLYDLFKCECIQKCSASSLTAATFCSPESLKIPVYLKQNTNSAGKISVSSQGHHPLSCSHAEETHFNLYLSIVQSPTHYPLSLPTAQDLN